MSKEDGYITGWHDDDNVILLYRDGDKKKTIEITDFKWYFYVDKTDRNIALLKNAIKLSVLYKKGIKLGKKYIRIYYTHSKRYLLLDYLRDNRVETYEADLNPLDLYMLTNDIKITEKYRILYFDIETDDRIGGIVPGRDRILSFGWYDNVGNSGCIIDDDERKLLYRVVNILEKYDVICGWNSRSFDKVVLEKRMYKKGVTYDFKRIIHYDMMWRMMKLGAYGIYLPNYKLDTVGKYFFNKGKEEFISNKIYKMYTDHRDMFIKYNLRDAELLKLIDEKVKMLELSILECRWCYTFLNQFYISKLLDNYILKHAHKKGIIYKTRKFDIEKKEKFAGGYVFDTDSGVHENVYVFDYKSLYPEIIKTFNISLDVLADKDDKNVITTANGLKYKKDSVGLVADIINKLLNHRVQFKQAALKEKYGSVQYEIYNLMQDTVKEISNSVYGILGNQKSRFFNIQMAESITLTGQYCVKLAAKYFTKLGHKIVAGDTDSIFVCTKNKIDAVKEAEKYNIFIAKYFKEKFNCGDVSIKLEYKKHYNRWVGVSKKRYAGHLTYANGKKEDYIDVVGLECIKANTIGYAKRAQEEILENILKKDKSLEYYVTDLIAKKDSFLNPDVFIEPKDIVISQKISKSPAEYKSDLVHVRLARKIQEENRGFYIGMILSYIISSHIPKLDGSLIADYDGSFDRIYYWDHQILPLCKRILECKFPDYDWDKLKAEIIVKKKRKKKIKKT